MLSRPDANPFSTKIEFSVMEFSLDDQTQAAIFAKNEIIEKLSPSIAQAFAHITGAMVQKLLVVFDRNVLYASSERHTRHFPLQTN